MNNLNLLHIFATVIILLSSLLSEAGRAPAPKKINKCCRIGEYLERNQVCVAGSSNSWVPLIFLISRGDYFDPKGQSPKFITFEQNTRPKDCKEYQTKMFHGGGNNIIIFSNGSLFLREKSIFVGMDDYCVDSEAALVCFRHIEAVDSLTAPQKKLTKLRKCCGPNAAYDSKQKTCIYQHKGSPQLTTPSNGDIFNSTDVDIIFGFPDCNSTNFAIVSSFNSELFDVETGKLTLEADKHITSDQFCLEYTVNSKDDEKAPPVVDIFTCAHHISSEHAMLRNSNDEIHFAVLSTGLFISVLFLAAALGAGFLMPSVHYVLHWQCQIYYIFCLLVGDLLLAVIQMSRDSLSESACTILAVCTHFFFLAAFFWLNTMCFNIWWTFRDFRPSSLEKNQELFRLRLFRVYAWGLSFIIAGTAAILEHTSEQNDFWKPGFGQHCWFKGDLEIFAYFFGPIGILLCVNLMLFASTARQLTCGLWKRDDVKSSSERTALGKVCLKLVVVMGVTWMADIISWIVGGPKYLWYFTDLINALQGVFIFIVVGCQPQVWAAVKRFWTSKTRQEATNTTNAVQHSSSSNGLPSIGDTTTNNTVASDNATKIPMETVC